MLVEATVNAKFAIRVNNCRSKSAILLSSNSFADECVWLHRAKALKQTLQILLTLMFNRANSKFLLSVFSIGQTEGAGSSLIFWQPTIWYCLAAITIKLSQSRVNFNYYPYRRKIKIFTRLVWIRLHNLHRRLCSHRYQSIAKHESEYGYHRIDVDRRRWLFADFG